LGTAGRWFESSCPDQQIQWLSVIFCSLILAGFSDWENHGNVTRRGRCDSRIFSASLTPASDGSRVEGEGGSRISRCAREHFRRRDSHVDHRDCFAHHGNVSVGNDFIFVGCFDKRLVKPLVMFCDASRLLRDFSGTWHARHTQNQQRFVEPLGGVIDIPVLGISAPNI
jgi:hypothetical protein